jgi:hypothetical protein
MDEGNITPDSQHAGHSTPHQAIEEESQLFLVRLWPGEGKRGWHGKVQHVASGTAGEFSDLASLWGLLLSLAPNQDLPWGLIQNSDDGQLE